MSAHSRAPIGHSQIHAAHALSDHNSDEMEECSPTELAELVRRRRRSWREGCGGGPVRGERGRE